MHISFSGPLKDRLLMPKLRKKSLEIIFLRLDPNNIDCFAFFCSFKKKRKIVDYDEYLNQQ